MAAWVVLFAYTLKLAEEQATTQALNWPGWSAGIVLLPAMAVGALFNRPGVGLLGGLGSAVAIVIWQLTMRRSVPW
jgi:hypothetical protein